MINGKPSINTKNTDQRKVIELNPSGKNPGDSWTITTQPFPEAHFAVMPPELARKAIRAGCPVGGVVLDPFMGAGTTALVAVQEGRDWLGVELSPTYAEMARKRILGGQPPLPGMAVGS